MEILTNKIDKLLSRYKNKGMEVNELSQILLNGETVLEERNLSAEEIDLAVRRVARVVKVGMFMDRYPAELSGGQQQRVAIARTLAPEPQVLFMDEPLSNLDAKLRLEMRYELQRLHVETGSTFVYVTHDQTEAMTLATKICLLDNGVLQQYDKPLSVYNYPNNTFVADFIGNPSINFINATGKQGPDGEIILNILGDYKIKFIPKEEFSLLDWYQKRNKFLLSEQKEREEKQLHNYIEKVNKDEIFRYHIAKVNEDVSTLVDDYQASDYEFVIGIRPEFVGINKGYIKGEIYGVLPTGMEVTLKLRVDDYLLTSVIFGGVTHRIGKKVNISFEGSDISLFDRVSGKLISSGTINKI
jgi:ABC-type sugar transport system ATPase subunit